ncbi:hypothetical protein MMC17_003582 [Xylographa soralifera]|nr:hypothetical protein [Xylographa soralifera]
MSLGSSHVHLFSWITSFHTQNPLFHHSRFIGSSTIGAGAAGVALGDRLKEKLGFDQFRIFHRQSDIGGTWWINRYPGVVGILAVDIPFVLYSSSFAPHNRWTSFFPEGPEMARYLHDVCDKYKIVDKIQLITDLSELLWLEKEQVWEGTLLYLAPGIGDLGSKKRQQRVNEYRETAVYIPREIVRAKIIVNCVGGLVEPKNWPEQIPGPWKFEGEMFRSSQWSYDADLTDKNVIVIGTGCSAAQLTALITKPHTTQSPVLKPVPPFRLEAWRKWSGVLFDCVPGVGRFYRTLWFAGSELDYHSIFQDNSQNGNSRKNIEAKLIKHIKRTVSEKYHEILTPDHSIGCKRRIMDYYWLDSMHDPKYNLTTQPLMKVNPKPVILAPGWIRPAMPKADSKVPTNQVELPADVIILANGFDISTWLHPLKAYLGTAMDGFPNFFIIFEPNTATGHSSVILAIENMIECSLRFIQLILSGDVETVEVKKSAEIEWTKAIQQELKSTV